MPYTYVSKVPSRWLSRIDTLLLWIGNLAALPDLWKDSMRKTEMSRLIETLESFPASELRKASERGPDMLCALLPLGSHFQNIGYSLGLFEISKPSRFVN